MQDSKFYSLKDTSQNSSEDKLNSLALSKTKKKEENNFEIIQSLQGHGVTGGCVAALPNGQVISGYGDGTLKVWDITTGQCIRTLQANSDSVDCVAVLLNGNVISGSEDNKRLRVCDINSGKCIITLKGHSSCVHCIVVLPNGNVISGSADSTLKVWNIATGKCITTLRGHKANVWSVAVLPNNKVISGSEDTTLRVWDINSGKCLTTLRGHNDSVTSVAVLPNEQVISDSEDNTLKVWDITTGHCVKTLQNNRESMGIVAVLPNGQVITDDSHNLNVWDINSGKCITTFQMTYPMSHNYMKITAIPNRKFITAVSEGRLKVWGNKRLEDTYQIKKAAIILAQGYRDKGCLFSRPVKLPEDILIKISSLTSNPQLHTKEQATEIANLYFFKPILYTCNTNTENKDIDINIGLVKPGSVKEDKNEKRQEHCALQ